MNLLLSALRNNSMIEFKGTVNTAKAFTNKIEEAASSQIVRLLNQEFVKGEIVRFMPDVHAGTGCVIGTTMTISDKVCPNLVGVDIGCGMLVADIGKANIDLERFDDVIKEFVPSGFNKREKPHEFNKFIDYDDLRAPVDKENARLSLGTLGGGNHFIEIDIGKGGNKYIVIHSGSRHLGLEIAKYYQEIAYSDMVKQLKIERSHLIEALKQKGRYQDIETAVSKLPKKPEKDLAYCTGSTLSDYLNDMKIAQDFATHSRLAMLAEIKKHMDIIPLSTFETRHNYIDLKMRILRKGAVSAQNGERLIIPINMKDGSLICIGKGNWDWNFSAPHGAGRIMSRGEAKSKITMDEYREAMKGIYSSSVTESTLDEAPFAYKPIEEIVKNIEKAVDIVERITPIYNFKAN